ELPPSFRHHPAAELPRASVGGAEVRLIAGTLFGLRSPVKTLSPLFYADATLDEDAALELGPEHEERGAYLVDGAVSGDGREDSRGQLLVFRAAVRVVLKARPRAPLMLFPRQTLLPPHVSR